MDRSEKDIMLFKQWEKSKSKSDFQNLYRHMLPMINKASQKAKYGSNVPESVFDLEAAQQFYTAINNYNPTKGTKLSSHIHGRIEDKLKRVNYTYQNVSRIIERSKKDLGVYHIGKFKNTVAILKDKLGREPSDVEIAQELKVTVPNVTRLRNEIVNDLSLNEELEDMVSRDDDAQIKDTEYMVYYDLPPEAQLVYDLARGLHGKKATVKANGKTVDWKRIGKQLGMSDSKIQKYRKMIANEMNRYNLY